MQESEPEDTFSLTLFFSPYSEDCLKVLAAFFETILNILPIAVGRSLTGIVLFQITDSLLRKFPRGYCIKKLFKPRESALPV